MQLVRTSTLEAFASNSAFVPEIQQEARLPASRTVHSRFGALEINTALAINFTQGLAGFPDDKKFCIADHPSPHLNEHFKLLQSTSNDNLCFIVMPFEHRNGTIAAHDLEEALQSVNIREENLLTLLLVSVHQDSDNIRRLSVNLRAPLFVDAITKQGAQHIFGNSSYAIRHMIS